MKVRFNKKTKLLKVDEPKLDQKYHCAWARSRGMVWVCKGIDKEKGTVILETPVTKKRIETKISDLRHTRSTQIKMLKKAL